MAENNHVRGRRVRLVITTKRVDLVAPPFAVQLLFSVIAGFSVGSCGDDAEASYSYVDVGTRYDCGITRDSEIECWGEHESTFEDLGFTFSPAPDGDDFQLLANFQGHAVCAQKSDTSIVCWGWDFALEGVELPDAYPLRSLDNLWCGVDDRDGSVVCWPDKPFAGHDNSSCVDVLPPEGEFTELAIGAECCICAISVSGDLVCTGIGPEQEDAAANEPAGQFNGITAGAEHVCGVRDDGEVVCWGDDEYNQSTPPDDSFVQIDASEYRTCGVTTAGGIECWGYDWIAENPACDEVPCECRGDVPTGRDFIQVSVGARHACGLHEDGTVTCWGDCCSGQCDPP